MPTRSSTHPLQPTPSSTAIDTTPAQCQPYQFLLHAVALKVSNAAWHVALSNVPNVIQDFTHLSACERLHLFYIHTYIYIWTHPPHDLPRSVSLVNTVKKPARALCRFLLLSVAVSRQNRPHTDHRTGRRDGRDQKNNKNQLFKRVGRGCWKRCFFWFCLLKRWFS